MFWSCERPRGSAQSVGSCRTGPAAARKNTHNIWRNMANERMPHNVCEEEDHRDRDLATLYTVARFISLWEGLTGVPGVHFNFKTNIFDSYWSRNYGPHVNVQAMIKIYLTRWIIGKEWHLGRFRRVFVYLRGLQTHTVDTKRPKCHSLIIGNFVFILKDLITLTMKYTEKDVVEFLDSDLVPTCSQLQDADRGREGASRRRLRRPARPPPPPRIRLRHRV